LAIEWHRAYQEVIERSKPSFDVVGEYKTLSDAEPADSGLLYLLARVTPNQSDKSRILDQAIEVSKSVSPYALYGKGYEFISKGEFDQALPYVERAVRAEPSNISFTTAYQTCLAAMGRWSEAIEKISKAHDDDSPISQTQKLTSTLPLMIAAGRRDEAEAKILQLVNGLEMPTESKQQWKAGLEDLLQYAAGDLNLIYSRYEEDELDLRFWMLVSQNKLDEATKMMAEADSVEDPNSYISHLLLYVRGHDANRADIADKHLKLAIARLETGDADERLLAGLLAAPELPGAETYVPTAWPSQSRTVALALSRRIPEKKAEYEALANRLNFERTFPYWFIKESIE
jgi:tetratricopeptide (TPR) repeat protein